MSDWIYERQYNLGHIVIYMLGAFLIGLYCGTELLSWQQQQLVAKKCYSNSNGTISCDMFTSICRDFIK